MGLSVRSVGWLLLLSHFTQDDIGTGLYPGLWLQAQVLPCSHVHTLLEAMLTNSV